jgi:cell division protease FtsH
MTMGGYVVEKMIFGTEMISTGPSNDLKNATHIARDMVTRYGMSSKLGPRTFGEHDELIFLGREIHEERDYSDKTAEEIDQEILALLNEAEKRAEKIIENNKEKLEAMVKILLEKETIEQEEIARVLGTKV